MPTRATGLLQSYDSISGALAATLNSAVTFTNDAGHAFANLYVVVPTGGAITFEGSADNSTWVSITFRSIASDKWASTHSKSGPFLGSIAAFAYFRVRVSTAGSVAGSVTGRVVSMPSVLEGLERPAPDQLGFEPMYGPMRTQFVAEPYRACGSSFKLAIDTNYWAVANSGAGSAAGVANYKATLSSGTANNGYGALATVHSAWFTFAVPMMFRALGLLTALVVANNIRRLGAFNVSSGTTISNGYYFEFSADGVLTCNSVNAGVITSSVTADVSGVSIAANVQNEYEIIYFTAGAWFLVDKVLVGRLIPTSSPLSGEMNLKAQAHTVNSASGTSSGTMELWAATILRMGRPESRAYTARITGASTTTLKTGAGKFRGIMLNTTGGTSATVYDNTSAAGTVLVAPNLGTINNFVYDIEFDIGLTVVTVGASADITVFWE